MKILNDAKPNMLQKLIAAALFLYFFLPSATYADRGPLSKFALAPHINRRHIEEKIVKKAGLRAVRGAEGKRGVHAFDMREGIIKLRALIEEKANRYPCTTVFLVGTTGVGKSTLAEWLGEGIGDIGSQQCYVADAKCFHEVLIAIEDRQPESMADLFPGHCVAILADFDYVTLEDMVGYVQPARSQIIIVTLVADDVTRYANLQGKPSGKDRAVWGWITGSPNAVHKQTDIVIDTSQASRISKEETRGILGAIAGAAGNIPRPQSLPSRNEEELRKAL